MLGAFQQSPPPQTHPLPAPDLEVYDSSVTVAHLQYPSNVAGDCGSAHWSARERSSRLGKAGKCESWLHPVQTIPFMSANSLDSTASDGPPESAGLAIACCIVHYRVRGFFVTNVSR